MKNNIQKIIDQIKQYKKDIKYFDLFEVYQKQLEIFEKSKKEIIFVYGILWVLENQLKILELIKRNFGDIFKDIEVYKFPKIFGTKNFLDWKNIFWKKEVFDIKKIISWEQKYILETLEKIRETLQKDFENYQKKFAWLKNLVSKEVFWNIFWMQKWIEFEKNQEKMEEIFQEIKKQIIIRSIDEKDVKNILEKIEFLIKKIDSKKISDFELEMFLNQLFIEFKNLQTLFSKLDK